MRVRTYHDDLAGSLRSQQREPGVLARKRRERHFRDVSNLLVRKEMQGFAYSALLYNAAQLGAHDRDADRARGAHP